MFVVLGSCPCAGSRPGDAAREQRNGNIDFTWQSECPHGHSDFLSAAIVNHPASGRSPLPIPLLPLWGRFLHSAQGSPASSPHRRIPVTCPLLHPRLFGRARQSPVCHPPPAALPCPTSRARYGFVKWALLWRPKAPQVQPGQGGRATTSQQEGLNPKEIVRPVRDRFTPWPPSTRQPAPTPGKRCPLPSAARWGSSWPAPRRMKKRGPSGPPAGAAMSGGPL